MHGPTTPGCREDPIRFISAYRKYAQPSMPDTHFAYFLLVQNTFLLIACPCIGEYLSADFYVAPINFGHGAV
jgi:hypothetical protein